MGRNDSEYDYGRFGRPRARWWQYLIGGLLAALLAYAGLLAFAPTISGLQLSPREMSAAVAAQEEDNAIQARAERLRAAQEKEREK